MKVTPLGLELSRTAQMSSLWDEAAECLKRFDCEGFDKAMEKFKILKGAEGRQRLSGE